MNRQDIARFPRVSTQPARAPGGGSPLPGRKTRPARERADAADRGWGILNQMDPQPGSMHFHPTMCPVIEVAEDGQTAQCAWTTFGFETGKDRETGELAAKYAWGTYGVDYIKEDGEWKFWHFHIYRLMMHDEGKPWTDKKYWDPYPKKDGEEVERTNDIFLLLKILRFLLRLF